MTCHLLLLVLILASDGQWMITDESVRVSVSAQLGLQPSSSIWHQALSAKAQPSSEQLSWPHLHTSGGVTPECLHRSFTTCFHSQKAM